VTVEYSIILSLPSYFVRLTGDIMNKPLEQDSPDTKNPLHNSIEHKESASPEPEDSDVSVSGEEAPKVTLPRHMPAEHPDKKAKRPRKYF